jgi:crotonobetainyl-CoA:carnitine CoA-transferase CaiB-like acyl-CoA transferase
VTGPLEGIRVVEVASWMFIPSGGSVLADWGAEVIKVEPPTGDPQRGLITSGLVPGGAGGVNFMIEQPNRSKKSVAVDLTRPEGVEALMRLVETADVFLTSYLPAVRQKLGIDVAHVRARKPDIVYARGSGQGPKGPDAGKGGYDAASYWARGGVGSVMPERAGGWPPGQVSPAFGDVMAGMATAGGIAAALVQRERTGEGAVVDCSLLATAMWQLSPLVVASKLFGFSKIPQGDRTLNANPLVNVYRTADDRFISLILLQSDKYFPELCACLGRPELSEDERFADEAARAENRVACVGALDAAFESQPLAHWTEALAGFSGVWSVFQTLDELYDDPQVLANGYLPAIEAGNGQTVQLVANPVQFDEQPVEVTRAPEHGEHTETVLVEAGMTWEEIAALKESGALP